MKKERGEGRNACYKNKAIRITLTDFLVIELCQLSICLPVRNQCMLLCMTDFTWEFTKFTTQHELANQNFVAASICRNEQKGSLLQASFPSLPDAG